MKSFTYEGMTFTPLRDLEGEEKDFNKISSRSIDMKLTPPKWSYGEFYKAAKENEAYVDLFEVNGKTVIPAGHCIFEYI